MRSSKPYDLLNLQREGQLIPAQQDSAQLQLLDLDRIWSLAELFLIVLNLCHKKN
jgi:hypothetical protein